MKGIVSLSICLFLFYILYGLIKAVEKNREYAENNVKAALYAGIAFVTTVLTYGKGIEESYLNFLIVAVSCVEFSSNYRAVKEYKKKQDKNIKK